MRSLLIITAIIALAAGAISYWTGTSNIPTPEYSEAIRNIAPATPSSSVQGQATAPRNAPNLPLPALPGLYAEYSSSDDYRVLFESLMQRSNEGGGFYARNLLHMCSGILDMLAAGAPESSTSNAQIRARQLLEQRCSGFTVDELSDARKKELLSDSRLKHDPLIALQAEWNRDATHAAKQQDVGSKVLASRDPMLIESMLAGVFMMPRSDGLYLAGSAYSHPDARQIANLALLSATCELVGTACGPTDSYVVIACATQNLCFNSRSDLMAYSSRQRFSEDGHTLYLTLLPKIVKAIREGDASAFVRPEKG